MKHVSRQKGKELVDAVHKAVDNNAKREEAIKELLEAAKFCYEMEYLHYIENNIPTSRWMSELFTAIVKYEELK